MTYDPKSFLAQTALKSLGFNPGELDGLWGEKSRQAMAAWLATITAQRDLEESGEFDVRTERNLATLLPAAQFAARKFMHTVVPVMEAHGLQVRITSGTRTYNEQDMLYAQGRAKPGPIVTNAPGGFSNHNFGVAWDITLFREDGQPVWESPSYRECADIGEAQGLDCGAFWKGLVDEPHYALKTGLTMAQMRERKNNGQPIV